MVLHESLIYIENIKQVALNDATWGFAKHCTMLKQQVWNVHNVTTLNATFYLS